jgi:hypothetical protein
MPLLHSWPHWLSFPPASYLLAITSLIMLEYAERVPSTKFPSLKGYQGRLVKESEFWDRDGGRAASEGRF